MYRVVAFIQSYHQAPNLRKTLFCRGKYAYISPTSAFTKRGLPVTVYILLYKTDSVLQFAECHFSPTNQLIKGAKYQDMLAKIIFSECNVHEQRNKQSTEYARYYRIMSGYRKVSNQ